MNQVKHVDTPPVDRRTTERIIKEILSWDDAHWDRYRAGLTAEQLKEMQVELDELELLFGKLKSKEFNWRKAVLVCLPTQYVGLLSEHFLTTSAVSLGADSKLSQFAPYCSHKNLMEIFYEDDGEHAPSSNSSLLTHEHAKFREALVDALYEGLANVLRRRGEAASGVLNALFYHKKDGQYLREVSYKHQAWTSILRQVGSYAYLLRDPESVLARDPIGARVTTFIRQVSAENHNNECPPNSICSKVLNDLNEEITPPATGNFQPVAEKSLHALLLHHLGLNRAYLEYSAHYLDICDYAPVLLEAIDFYQSCGIHIENQYIDDLQEAGGPEAIGDESQLLMQLVDQGLRARYPDLALSKAQCKNIIELTVETIDADKGAINMLLQVSKQQGSAMADTVYFQLKTMSAFCFIWFFIRNEHVSTRVYGRKHAKFSLLGRSLKKSFAELEVSQQNSLKHIVMAVRRSGQWRFISTAKMQDYLRARAFNLVTLTAKVAAVKRMDLHGFGCWAQHIQFSDYLATEIGEKIMIDVPVR